MCKAFDCIFFVKERDGLLAVGGNMLVRVGVM